MIVRRWGGVAIWIAAFVLVTLALVQVREDLVSAEADFPFLLVVLGASVAGGRWFGFATAAVSVVVIDYFLQPPFDQLFNFGRGGDLVALTAFLAVSLVASQLLDTAQKERDAALRWAAQVESLSEEREHLTAETQRLTALHEAERLKEFVLSSVSHDLRTPLTTIKALAQDEQRTGESRAQDIEHEADRLSRMVGELLDLSRLRGGGFPVQPELNAAEDVIGAALQQCRAILDGKRIRVDEEDDAPALYGLFDLAATLRILGNLLENALRYTPAAGEVELGARRENGALVFRVSDRGPGVADGDRERIFQPFYRSPGSLPDQGRAGLGLAIARALAEAQGGRLACVDRTGGGTVFELSLPAVDPSPY